MPASLFVTAVCQCSLSAKVGLGFADEVYVTSSRMVARVARKTPVAGASNNPPAIPSAKLSHSPFGSIIRLVNVPLSKAGDTLLLTELLRAPG